MTLVGCSTDLYVRDMDSNAVRNADVVVMRWSVAGCSIGKTDSEGHINVPWGLPGIEYITATKNELTGTLSYTQLGSKPYIVVVRPITENQMPVLNFDTGYSTPYFTNENRNNISTNAMHNQILDPTWTTPVFKATPIPQAGQD